MRDAEELRKLARENADLRARCEIADSAVDAERAAKVRAQERLDALAEHADCGIDPTQRERGAACGATTRRGTSYTCHLCLFVGLQRENADLRARTLADDHLRADTERLDWLSVVRAGSWYPFQNQQGEWWIVHHDAKLSVGPEPTLRAAIDSAMAKEKP